MTKPYTYVVRFDISPYLTAKGFILDDRIAYDMLKNAVQASESDVAARVLGAPPVSLIERAQKREPSKLGSAEKHRFISKMPVAYSCQGYCNVVDSVAEAIKLIDSVAFVRDENDNTAEVLANLRDTLDVLTGKAPISVDYWREAE
ncbi:hypothetical protein ABVL22_004270 [Salmonella enterica]